MINAVQAASARGHWCVGFVAHEAAPAFDAALRVRPPAAGPLAWFAEFAAPSQTPTPAVPENADFSVGEWQSDMNHAVFGEKVESIRADIRDGRFYQVNLTTRLRADFVGEPLAFYRGLQRSQPNGYHAFIDTGAAQLLSVSPELFFALYDGKITTQPMKGTAPRGDTPDADERIAWELTHSAKERAENLMIVDLLRNDLSRVAEPHSVEVASLFALQPLPSVWQMTSTINATLRSDQTLTDIFAALFPCGSVTGAPKVEAMHAIETLELSPRGAYCGAIGYVAPMTGGQMRACFNVGIRSIWIESASATCGVGGGITWDSTAEGEWAEVVYKSRFAKRASKAFSLLETLRLQDGAYHLLEAHLDRLANSARHFRFAFERESARGALLKLLKTHGAGDWRVRLLVAASGECRVEALPLDTLPNTPTYALATTPVMSRDEFLLHKTTRRGVYDAHWTAALRTFDTLLWNERGELTEFTRANLIVRIDGQDFTPPVECGLLNGTERARLVASGECAERVLTVKNLSEAEAMFWVNSVRGRLEIFANVDAK